MNRHLTAAFALLFLPVVMFADTAEIRISLKLDGSDFIVGERIRGVIDVANPSPDTIRVGFKDSCDSLFVEVFRASDQHQLTLTTKIPFVSPFILKSNEGQKLETFLGDHYGLCEPSRYLAKPVLVHGGVRFEGTLRAFDIVEGVQVGKATQLFANRKGLQREFRLLYWNRNHHERLFLAAQDSGISTRRWETRDLGEILRIDRPTISVMPQGEVIVLHRITQDQFVRTEFWSLPKELEFRRNETVDDPATASTSRVRGLYKDGGIKAKENPWWKFW